MSGFSTRPCVPERDCAKSTGFHIGCLGYFIDSVESSELMILWIIHRIRRTLRSSPASSATWKKAVRLSILGVFLFIGTFLAAEIAILKSRMVRFVAFPATFFDPLPFLSFFVSEESRRADGMAHHRCGWYILGLEHS